MVCGRVKTPGSQLGVLDLDGYDFDSGMRGFFQRVHIASKHLLFRTWNSIYDFFHSFIGMHYCYVISWALILSWIIFPQRNITYTDALFQAVSAVTMTGLNTVDLNELKLYQQVFIFVIPMVLHPLNVATFMVFYRLHLFRKKFDDIEQTSKQQSKLRRVATFQQLERKQTRGREPQAVNLQLSNNEITEVNDKEVPTHYTDGPGPSMLQANTEVEKKPKESDSSQSISSDSSRVHANTHHHHHNNNNNEEAVKDNEDDKDDTTHNKIRFGALPRPPLQGRTNNPSDMFRSLQQMRSQNHVDDMDEDDGPALVIKSPRDIEADEQMGIHSAVANENDVPRQTLGRCLSNNLPSNPLRRLSTNRFDYRPPRPLTRSESNWSTVSGNAKPMRANYLSWTPTVGGNSAFVGMSHGQIEELGGVEYRALKVLRWLGIAYFVGLICIGWVFIVPWVYERKTYKDDIESYGVTPVLFGITTVVSGFNNCGLCVVPTSLADFWHTAYVPVVISFMIMFGNVALPLLLRFIVWIVFQLSPRFGHTRETMGFLLDHPRRCFMLLFPSTTTWWLGFTIIIFMIVEIGLFMILDSGTHSPQENMSAGPRLLSAYFQSVTVRSAGFSVINVGAQAPGMLVLNVIMMYAATYPVAMSIRKSNVYEEQTLGRYAPSKTMGNNTYVSENGSVKGKANTDDNESLNRRNRAQQAYDEEVEDLEEGDTEKPSTLVDHIRRQLSMDAWAIGAGLLLVAISEGGSISRGKYSLFAVLYEVISANCTIGLSMGVDGLNSSLSTEFSNVGKLILMAVMIRGRHRGMPYNVDRAILLSGADLMRRDNEQENRISEARVMTHREPSQQETWIPRVATTASKITKFSTLRRRPTMSGQGTNRTTGSAPTLHEDSPRNTHSAGPSEAFVDAV